MRSLTCGVAISGKASSLWGINCTSDAEVVISGSEGELTSEEDSGIGVEEG